MTARVCNVISVAQALAADISAASIEAVAEWNEENAARAKGEPAEDRLRRQAKLLREVAATLGEFP